MEENKNEGFDSYYEIVKKGMEAEIRLDMIREYLAQADKEADAGKYVCLDRETLRILAGGGNG